MDDGYGTQEVNFTSEMEEMDLANETQVINLGDETQQLDDDWSAVAEDSDGEGSQRTEVLCDDDDVLDDGFTSHYKVDQQGVREHPNTLTDKEPNSEVHVPTSTPMDQGSPAPIPGSMRFTLVRAASLRASGLSARNRAMRNTKSRSSADLGDKQKGGQVAIDTDGATFTPESCKVRVDFDGKHDLGDRYDNLKGLYNESNCQAGNSTVRKLFTENLISEDTMISHNNHILGNKISDQLPSYDDQLAGLSYIDSQEPGELSQANALEFVDRFIKDTNVELDLGVRNRKVIAEKSKSVPTAKGSKSLAKIVKSKSTVGKSWIFDWDDNREDEGGGDIFLRRRGDFFGRGGDELRSFTEPRKLKGSRVELKDKEVLNIYDTKKTKGHSASRLDLCNSKETENSEHQAAVKSKKNLINELDKRFIVNSCLGKLENNATETNEQEIPNVGFDTQMAAEAMEALYHVEGIVNGDITDDHQLLQNNSKGLHIGSPSGKAKNCLDSRQSSSRKRIHVSNVEFSSEHSKKAKSIGAKLRNKSSDLSKKLPKNISKNISKQGGVELVMTRSMRAKSNADETHGSKTLNGGITETKRLVQEEIGNLAPIAHRTRHALVVNQFERAEIQSSDTEQRDVLTEVGAVYKNRENGKGVGDSKMLNERVSKSAPKHSKQIKNVRKSQNAQSKFIKNDLLNSVRGRFHHDLLGQVSLSDHHVNPSRSEAQSIDGRQIVTRSKRTCSGTGGTCNDQSMKKKTRSSAVSCCMNKELEDGLHVCFDKEDSGKVIVKDVVQENAVEQSDRQNDASSQITPEKKSKPSDSVHTTPDTCKTPVNYASPVCMGNEYYKQSYKKNLSGPCLLREIRSLSAMGPEPALQKHSRKRRDITGVRVLFSQHLDEDIIKQQKKIRDRLGIAMVSSITDATHFIADKFVRTRNMLEAIALGKPVVTPLWIENCGQASCFIDENNYIMRDTKKEKEFGFSMPVSLARARQLPLLQGQRVLITQNTKPGKDIILGLVKAVKGQAVERVGRYALKNDTIPDDLLVLSCEEDYDICVPFLEKGATIYSSELLLNGIVTQKLEFERHRLFADRVKKTRSTIWMKKDGKTFTPAAKNL